MSEASLRPAQEVIEAGLEASSAECVVIVEDSVDANVRFANSTTTTNGRRRDRRVSVTAMVELADGIGVGVASGSGAMDIAQLVAAAEADAKAALPAEDVAPFAPAVVDADFGDPPAELSFAIFTDLLVELGEAFGRARASDHALAGFAVQELDTTYLGTSTGLRRRHLQPTGSLELVARSTDGSRSAWAGRGVTELSEVALGPLETDLLARLEIARRKIDLPAGRYETILPPDAAADLVIELAWALSGRDAEDGRSVFSKEGGGTRLGERLMDQPFTLRSDPRYPGLECTPFLVTPTSSAEVSAFDNGLDLAPMSYVEGGTLERLYYHRAGAERSGTAFTPPIDNLVLELPGATATLDELVANSERALLLTCLWYIREVDPQTLLLTGLTRDGVYLVEHGEIVGAVNNFRFNESPLDLLRKTTEAGKTERALSREWGEWMSRTAMPPLRVEGFNMSSVSQAS
jgi:predicted Zn-dependent protease